jgi:hypothetical protein
MKKTLLVAAALVGAAAAAAAQAPNAAAIKDSIGASVMRLHKYQWLQTMTVAVKGETKQTSVSQCMYQGGSPKPQCTEISSTPAAKPSGGPIRKRAMENAIAEMKAYMDSVKTLIGQYVPPQKEKIEAAMQSGNVSVAPNPSTGGMKLAVNNYAQQGDQMAFVVGAQDNRMRSVNINTYLSDPSSVVSLVVNYAALPDGTRYAKTTTLNATAKQIVVTVTTANYAIAAQ